MVLVHLDFETFSELPIAAGTHKYLTHPSTEMLLVQWAREGDGVQVHEGPSLPDIIKHDAADPNVTFVAFNAEFERLVLLYLFGIDIPPERWICTMARAWSLSFVGGLDDVCRQMGLPADKQKFAKGRKLMLKFSQPRRPSKNNPDTRWTKDNAPEDWEAFSHEYAAQDVVASRAVLLYCERYPWAEGEHEMWCLDQRINDKGWPLDMQLVANADKLRIEEERRLMKDLKALTHLGNPNSISQLSGWLKEQGVGLPNMQKQTLIEYLESVEDFTEHTPNDPPIRALRIRQQLARTTPKKWAALKLGEHEGRIKATLEFGAAQRTQRWGGRMFQPQNLYTDRVNDTDVLADIMTHASRDTVEAVYGNVMDALSGAIRPSITAAPGKRLVVVDYNSIESVLLGWHSGEPRINNLFAAGLDTYKDLASRLFNIPVGEVTKEQRTFAKPPELGCGYYLGAKGLVEYAKGMGVEMDQEFASYAVRVWRDSNPEVVKMWRWFGDVVVDVTRNYTRHEGYGVVIYRDESFLFIVLPSGRRIFYYMPLIQNFKDREGREWHDRPQLTYMGRYGDSGGAWQRIYTHPGKITENIIQACARDVLCYGLKRINGLGLSDEVQIIGHVHDEPVLEVDEVVADDWLQACITEMSAPVPFLPGCILRAEGFTARRYRKG